jgi:hypothetical protein
LIFLLLFAAPAAAQKETTDLGEASLEELGNIQVYTASKHLRRAFFRFGDHRGRNPEIWLAGSGRF